MDIVIASLDFNQRADRFKLVPTETSSTLSNAEHVVSFVGATFNGKSDLARRVLVHNAVGDGEDDGSGGLPIVAARSSGAGVSTTANVNAHYYSCGARAALLDFEGSDAACAPALAVDDDRTGPQSVRAEVVGAAFSALAHLLSDVVVLVECAPLFSCSMYERACRRVCAGAARASRIRPLGQLPQLVIVANKLPLTDCVADSDEATADFVRALPEETMRALRRHFSAVRCVCVPYRDGSDAAAASFAAQLAQLAELVAPLDAAQPRTAERLVWSAQRIALCADRGRLRAAMEELLADGLGLGSAAAAAAAAATPGVATVAATATASQLLDNRYASRPRAPPPARPRPHSTTATVTRVATVAVASGAAIYLLWRWQRARRRRRDEGSTRRLSRKK